jgi:hypothetical protein
VLGTSAALALAVRPYDGAALGLGVLPIFAWLLARRRLQMSGFAAAAAAFAVVGGVTLVILRLQLGRWFATGYSVTPLPITMSVPKPSDLAYAFKIDKGTGYWFPCGVPFLAAGLLAARGAGRPTAWTLFLAGVAQVGLYSMVEYNRDATDSGYGVRYLLPLVVPMAVGTGIVATIIVRRSRVAAAAAGATGAAALIAVAAVLFPYWWRVLEACSALDRAIATERLHNAVVLVHGGEFAPQAWDLTRNLPSQREPDVMIITDYGPGAEDDLGCARRRWPNRTWYTARQRFGPEGWGPVDITRTRW